MDGSALGKYQRRQRQKNLQIKTQKQKKEEINKGLKKRVRKSERTK